MAYFITDTCISCGLCEQKCPTDTISGAKKEVFQIHPEGCIECGVCAIYCPVSCIENPTGELVEKVPQKEIPKAVVDLDNCTACEYCIDICPFDCITLEPDPRNPSFHYKVAVVNAKTCVSCRLCEIVCDKDAIWVPDPKTNLAAMLPQQVKSTPFSRQQEGFQPGPHPHPEQGGKEAA